MEDKKIIELHGGSTALSKLIGASPWKLDLDDLRDVVLRRGGQIATLDLTKLY